jgi:clan AA aspartic protease
MISGSVSQNLEAKVSLDIQGPNGLLQIETLLDTGFSGFLTLPGALITGLGWPWLSRHAGTLADGSVQVLEAYEATILWDGQLRIVEVIALDAHPLAGMKLLEGYELRVSVKPGGNITVSALP